MPDVIDDKWCDAYKITERYALSTFLTFPARLQNCIPFSLIVQI